MSAYDRVFRMVTDWQRQIESPAEGGQFKELLEHLAYLERVKFQPYLPALYSNRFPPSFMERFDAWLNNVGVAEEEKKALFQFAEHIAFFSFDDFAALFQNAFSGPITRWCMDQAGIRLANPGWLDTLNEERYRRTWFCPVTDSLLISLFHHVNVITDKERKPSFRDLAAFGSPELVLKHIRKNQFNRLVLLEDFIGTGTQAMKAVKWALKNLPIPILFCPIIAGEEAVEHYSKLIEKVHSDDSDKFQCPSFEFKPIFKLGGDCFAYDEMGDTPPLFENISKLNERIHKSLETTNNHCPKGEWGFCNEDSKLRGSTAVMFSNTPNNSLPLIWHGAEGLWNPLFPRVARQSL